jgi:hypothetical protein
MLYAKGTVVDGKLVVTDEKVIDSSSMTDDCWLIQFKGISACQHCELRGTDDCGGGDMLKALEARR